MRVFGWSNAVGGVHHYRIREPLRGLSLLGHETRTLPAANLAVFESFDVVLVRGLHNPRNSMLWQHAAQANKHALRVYDLDDDIWGWPPGTKEYDYWNDERRLHAELNIQAADLVTTTTPALAEVLLDLNPRIAILPNTIPERLLRLLPPLRDRFIIGWQGAQQHIKDLELIYNPVLRFMLKHPDVDFHLWGPGQVEDFPDALAHRIICHPWTHSVWGHYLRLNMDIGLAPIDVGDTFNATKSDIKLREYASLGIPFIASRAPAYTNTAEAARGMVADSEDEWEAALTELYDNRRLREWMAEQGRLRARLWTTEGNAQDRERAYERARSARNLRDHGRTTGVLYSPNGDQTIRDVSTRERT